MRRCVEWLVEQGVDFDLRDDRPDQELREFHLTMEGENGNVNLSVRPENYWQTHYTDDGVTGFYIDHEEDDQTILGLPFMNNYYCVFDRSANDGLGTVQFFIRHGLGDRRSKI